MRRLRLAFMGTPDFSVSILNALIASGHEVVCVYSQPPRPAGRGQKERPTPVHAVAEAAGIPVRTPKSLKSAEEQAAFAELNLDCAIVAAYGLILPKAILDAPKMGCLNVHASLLPRWRGAAPIQRAIEAGDAETGVTIMQMDVGLDTGDMLIKGVIPITSETTASVLHDQLAEMGADLIVKAVNDHAQLTPEVQPEAGVTYAHKLTKDEGRLDWSQSAASLDLKIRGLNPWPGVWCEINGERVKVLEASLETGKGPAGTVLDDALLVACGDGTGNGGALRLTKLQRAGRGPMLAADLLRGWNVARGVVLV